MAAYRAVPCIPCHAYRVMSASYGRMPFCVVSSKSQPRVMPCHVTHFLPLVRAVSWRVMTFKWRVMACRVMACHVPLRAVACRVISMRFEADFGRQLVLTKVFHVRLRVMACLTRLRVMACHTRLRVMACRVMSCTAACRSMRVNVDGLLVHGVPCRVMRPILPLRVVPCFPFLH